MAIKLDWAYSYDAEGKILFGDSSFVTCSDEDPYRMRKVDEIKVLELLEKQRQREKKAR